MEEDASTTSSPTSSTTSSTTSTEYLKMTFKYYIDTSNQIWLF